MKDFKKLKIWQRGFQIAANSFKFTNTLPKEEKYGLVSQINRSGVSIPSNIAEGCSRTSNKDQLRFIEISLGSSFELETQLLITSTANFGDKEIRDVLSRDVDEEQKMLIGYIKTLSKDS